MSGSLFAAPDALAASPVPIRPAAQVPPLPQAVADSSSGAAQRFVNGERNSRLPAVLPAGTFRLRWRASLDQGLHPTCILQSGDAIVVPGARQWQLFRPDGAAVAAGPLRFSEVYLDPSRSVFYHAGISGPLSARRLADGSSWFYVRGAVSERSWLAFLAARGRRITVVAIERAPSPHGSQETNSSSIQVLDLGEPMEVSPTGLLESAREVRELACDTSRILAAMHDQTLAVATPNRVYLTDGDLHVRAAFQAEFEPVALSLDEALRIYLIVDAEGGRALWVLTPQGERQISYELPADLEAGSVPPIVGYDHWIYLTGKNRILTLNAEGKLIWERTVRGLAGAAVTADHQLLVSAGPALLAFDEKGAQRLLSSSPAEPLQVPPVLTLQGELLAASKSSLFCLAPQPR